MVDPDPEWRLLREGTRPPAMQMALDEVAARTAGGGGPRTVRLYRWPDALSLGYAQDPDTVDWAFCEDAGVPVTRRPTGGGAIYHGAAGDLSYSIAAPSSEYPGGVLDAYRELLDPVLDAFDRLDLPVGFAETERPGPYPPACYLRPLHPAHDLVLDGRKVSGNAQYRRADAVVQHGSVSLALDPATHRACFVDPPDEGTFRERVGALDRHGVDRAAAVSAFEAALGEWAGATAGEWTDEELAAARTLAEDRYGNPEWVRRDPS